MTNRRRVVAAAATLAATGVAGCLGGADGSGSAGGDVGVPAANYPFAFRSRCCTWEANPLEGFDVALVEALSGRVDAALSATPVDPAGPAAVAALRDGSVRALAPGAPLPTTTPDGLAAVEPTVRGYLTVLVASGVGDDDAGAPAVADLNGRTVLAPPTPARTAATERLRSLASPEVVAVDDAAAARDRVAAGDAAGLLVDQVTAGTAAAAGDGTILRGTGGVDVGYDTPYLALAGTTYGLLFRAGDDLAGRVGTALSALRGDSRFREIREEFFRTDGTPRSL